MNTTKGITILSTKKTKKPKKQENKQKVKQNDENLEQVKIVKVDQTKAPSFSDIGIEPWLVDQLDKLHMKIPTEIQEKCIPPTLAGKNIIGMSQTGSGKTAAFALPIIQTLAKDLYGIYALVITPTRELAYQIQQHFQTLSGGFVRVALITGGLDYLQQSELLDSRPHVVIGTPGRIEASMRLFNNHTYFKKIKYLVFDEADRLLSSEFALDVHTILEASNPKRQTLLYSATMNDQVKKLSQLSMQQDPDNIFLYDACTLFTTADNLEQFYIFMPKTLKECYLFEFMRKVLKTDKKEICMVFFSHVEDCEITCKIFKNLGFKVDSLHAAKSQKDRIKVLKEFKNRQLAGLFCTDVGNRGLDIPSVNYVINFDIPDATDKYVHRVGRTARAGRVGTSISFVSPHEVKRVETIEKDTKVIMKEFKKIKERDAEMHLMKIAQQRIKAKVQVLEDGFAENYVSRGTFKQQDKEMKKHLEEFLKRKVKQLEKEREKKEEKKEEPIEEKEKIEKRIGGIKLISKKGKKRKKNDTNNTPNKRKK